MITIAYSIYVVFLLIAQTYPLWVKSASLSHQHLDKCNSTTNMMQTAIYLHHQHDYLAKYDLLTLNLVYVTKFAFKSINPSKGEENLHNCTHPTYSLEFIIEHCKIYQI